MENFEKSEEKGDLTRLLDEHGGGNAGALEDAFSIVYNELRRLARSQLRNEKGDHTLVATALVNEAYLKLLGNPIQEWHGRAHFFGVAARAMRQILVEYARRRHAQKRGADQHRTTMDERFAVDAMDTEELLALNEALERLGSMDDRARKVVEYRFYCGLADKDIADLLDVSQRTVERDWVRARAWLYKELYAEKTRP